MPEDLNISDEQLSEAEFELSSPHDDIAAAYNALSAISELDTALQTKADAARIRSIKRMGLKIIHEQIKYIHDCIFEEIEEDD
jgi:hypothetical protein